MRDFFARLLRHVLSLLRPVAAEPRPAATFTEFVAEGDRARDRRAWVDAARGYREALRLRPDALGISVQLGHMLKESGHFDEAETAYRQFLEQNPADADIHLQMGHLFMRREREEDAEAWYRRALDLTEAGTPIAEDARRGIATAGDAPIARARRAALRLTDQRRFAEAHTQLEPLIARGCEDLTGIMGNVCKELGLIDEAEGWYRRHAAHAEGADARTRFEAALQFGHFEKFRRNPIAAIGHFARASTLFAEVKQPEVSRSEIEDEIRLCLADVTTAITLR